MVGDLGTQDMTKFGTSGFVEEISQGYVYIEQQCEIMEWDEVQYKRMLFGSCCATITVSDYYIITTG